MIEIRRWTDGKIIFTAENAGDVREALRDANLRYANLSYANLSSANLSYANLSYANLRSANLSYANLSSANLSSANLSYANLRSADLSYANLRYANLSSANLSYANLRYANLSYANLRYANLSYANLRSANLSYANLRYANLSYANLRSAKGHNPWATNHLLLLRHQIGKIRAYKLVDHSGEGPFNGGITYEIGKSYEVKDANCNADIQCGAGINLATLPWCIAEWREGFRILICEFTAADIAAIPIGDGKFRVKKCKVIRDVDLAEIGLQVAEEAAA